MPYHIWGDEDFNWDSLHKAERYITNHYEAVTGKYPIMKEKYGTLRYEFVETWLETSENVEAFTDIILEAVDKWPEVASEIVDDLCGTLIPNPRNTIDFKIGKIHGILQGKCGDKWERHI